MIVSFLLSLISSLRFFLLFLSLSLSIFQSHLCQKYLCSICGRQIPLSFFLMSVSLFIIFVKANLTKKTKVIKFIEKNSQHTLGIYLLHDAPYNYLIFADCFIWFQGFSTSKNLVFVIVLITILVFTVSLIVLITILVFTVSLIVSIIKKFTADRLYQVIFDNIEQKLKKSLNSSHL